MGGQTGGQAEDLLKGISAALPRITDKLESVLERQKELEGDLRKELRELRDRIVELEAKEEVRQEWSGEERRKVAGRLETGDHTFLKIENKADNAAATAERAYNAAKTALAAIEAATSDRPREGTTRTKKTFWKLVEATAHYWVPALITGAGWLIYHLRFLAELAARAKSTGGHP